MMDLITQRLMLRDIMPGLSVRFPEYAANIREIYKEDEIPFLRRAFVPKDLEFHASENAIVGIINSITKDWYDEVVLPEGIVKDVYSGIVLWNHDYFREAAPHARNQWVKPNSKDKPTHLLAKTEYLVELSQLAREIYPYREKNNPLGQSIGFIPLKWVMKDDEAWDDIYADWKERILAWKGEQGVPKGKIDTSPPYKIYTKWALLEYSDVYLPANPDAVAVAVSRGWIKEIDADKYMIRDEDDEMEIDWSKAVKYIPGLQGEPYKNEHACQLEPPGDFDEFARENCKVKVADKCLDFLYGIKDGKSKLQAYRYRKSEGWTASAAKSHCEKHDGKFEAATEEDSVVLDPGEHVFFTEDELREAARKQGLTVDKFIAKNKVEDFLAALRLYVGQEVEPEPIELKTIDPEKLREMIQEAANDIELFENKPISLNFSVEDFLASLRGELR